MALRRIENLQVGGEVKPGRDGHVVEQLDAVFGAEPESRADEPLGKGKNRRRGLSPLAGWFQVRL